MVDADCLFTGQDEGEEDEGVGTGDNGEIDEDDDFQKPKRAHKRPGYVRACLTPRSTQRRVSTLRQSFYDVCSVAVRVVCLRFQAQSG